MIDKIIELSSHDYFAAYAVGASIVCAFLLAALIKFIRANMTAIVDVMLIGLLVYTPIQTAKLMDGTDPTSWLHIGYGIGGCVVFIYLFMLIIGTVRRAVLPEDLAEQRAALDEHRKRGIYKSTAKPDMPAPPPPRTATSDQIGKC